MGQLHVITVNWRERQCRENETHLDKKKYKTNEINITV